MRKRSVIAGAFGTAMDERTLLNHIYRRSADLGPGVVVGPGDDCAVVNAGGGLVLLTTDQLVERRHFEPTEAIDLIARKAVARSVSDIAAMGGSPMYALATAVLPRGETRADALFDAMARWARHWGCPLVGGDIASHADDRSPLLLQTTVVGEPGRDGAGDALRIVRRSTASPGDTLWVTGCLGGSLKSGRHLRFEPRVREGLALASVASAMMDLSDGLGVDGSRLAAASGVTLEIDAGRLPAHDACTWQQALGDGEDYELLFTLPPGRHAPDLSCGVTRIGRVEQAAGSPGVWITTPDGERTDAADEGWLH